MKTEDIDITKYNRLAWDKEVDSNSPWSQPVSSDEIADAKKGKWNVKLTPRPLPSGWLEDVKGLNILCLASGGGQQAPLLAAAGAKVTVLDNSAKQLAQDQYVAHRDNLELNTVQGDMSDLSPFKDESFDLIFHPISNLYVPDVKAVWKESFRVLKKGGKLLASFYNPIVFVFDRNLKCHQEGILKPKYSLPYSDVTSLTPQEKQLKIEKGQPLVFGHTLTDQIAGQIEAGFSIVGFYEDYQPNQRFLIDKYVPCYIATQAVK